MQVNVCRIACRVLTTYARATMIPPRLPASVLSWCFLISLQQDRDFPCIGVLGCEQKSIEVEFCWSNLRVCNANYAAKQAIDAKLWWREKVCRTLGVAHRVFWVVEKANQRDFDRLTLDTRYLTSILDSWSPVFTHTFGHHILWDSHQWLSLLSCYFFLPSWEFLSHLRAFTTFCTLVFEYCIH